MGILIGHGITESQKAAIRRDRDAMSGPEVAAKHGITRQRVQQILHEPVNEQKWELERALGLPDYSDPEPVAEPLAEVSAEVTLFKCVKHRHLEDLALQQAIRREPPNYSSIARKYGTTVECVRNIRLNKSYPRRPKLTPSERYRARPEAYKAASRRWRERKRQQRLADLTAGAQDVR